MDITMDYIETPKTKTNKKKRKIEVKHIDSKKQSYIDTIKDHKKMIKECRNDIKQARKNIKLYKLLVKQAKTSYKISKVK